MNGLAPSIAFPTIIRDRTSGQGIPLGFIVAVNNEYDEQFGLTTVAGEPVQMEALRTGVGNIFAWADSAAQGQALTRGILQLFQGFLALGLLVGIAALGVISARTVVERQQQVGMLRAFGYQPEMVALSFVLEASFIALVGMAWAPLRAS